MGVTAEPTPVTEPDDAEDPHRCAVCGRTFDSRAARERHLREIGLVD